jgi:monothiol glutaredoxin
VFVIRSTLRERKALAHTHCCGENPRLTSSMNLYVKLWCPWCVAAWEHLDAHGYQYNKIDVLADKVAFDRMVQLSGQTKTPTLEWNGHVLADFGPNELVTFLKKHGITP